MENNIKMGLKEIRYEFARWIQVAQCLIQWRSFCILLRTFESQKAGIFIHGLNNYEFFKKDPADNYVLTFKYLFLGFSEIYSEYPISSDEAGPVFHTQSIQF
jgi:hypothetical protein